ncbi:GNAT family N-acetyltransferase [Propionivibrio limicola]|uniref:GNAT family N-acetyltransferase n=1 Tax=Propionivibrio limicola TaxID=167645 RepID=UPI001291EB48|nr:GNAT family N-acetyltransferase [Propionivibrio limicola]
MLTLAFSDHRGAENSGRLAVGGNIGPLPLNFPSARTMNIEPIHSLEDVTALLHTCRLSTDDIPSESPPFFFGIRAGGRLIAAVGLELYGDVGLLRSLAVDDGWRGQRLGSALVAFAETHAFNHGANTLYLFSSTAVPFFRGHGYVVTRRDEAPEAIRKTPQYAGRCSSEAFMCKTLTLLA